MIGNIWIGFALFITLSQCALPTTYNNSQVVVRPVELLWNIIGDDSIQIALLAPCTNCWMAVGFGATSMTNADVWQCTVKNGAAVVLDGWSTRTGNVPSGDTTIGGQDNCLEKEMWQNGTHTLVTFLRKLSTGDQYDGAIQTTLMDVIVAYNQNSNDITRQHQQAGNGQVNFFANTPVPTNYTPGPTQAPPPAPFDFVLLHGFLMGFSWTLLAIPSVFLARFFKYIGHGWFKAHLALNIFLACAVLVAFIVVVYEVGNDWLASGLPAINYTHIYLGLFVVVSIPIQMFFGWKADHDFQPSRHDVPFWPDKVHWFFGRSIIFFAIVNIFLGLVLYQADKLWYILMAVFLVVAFLLFGVFQFKGLHHKSSHSKSFFPIEDDDHHHQ